MVNGINCVPKPIVHVPTTARKTSKHKLHSTEDFENFEKWEILHDKQEDVEKMRMYFTLVAWEVVSKIFPDHRIHQMYQKYILEPTNLASLISDPLDEITASFNTIKTIPKYSCLGISNQSTVFKAGSGLPGGVKTELNE